MAGAIEKLIREVHRRSMWQVAGIFVAASWVVLQVVDLFVDRGLVPEWTFTAAVVLLLLGLPVVLATAFLQGGVGARGATTDSPDPEAAPLARDGPASGDPSPAMRPPHSDEPGGFAPTTSSPAGTDAEPSGAARLFTWRRALLGGGAAFVLLALGVGGWLFMRSAGIGPAGTLVAKGILEERDPILLADFEDRASDPDLALTITEALRTDLAQSSVVRLVDRGTVAEELSRMERDAGEPLDPSLALEVAQRTGVEAVLTGELGRAGSAYIITAHLLAAEDGRALLDLRETARAADDVIDALERLSRRLRERVGEPLGDLQSIPPLARVTTGDLEALRLYTRAAKAIEVDGETDRGIALLEEAIARDTAFAAAYRKLGVTLGNADSQRSRSLEALRKAYAHLDRLSAEERYMTMASYASNVENDPRAALAAYESLLEIQPDHHGALNNAGVAYYVLGDLARSEAAYLRAADVDPTGSAFPLMNVVWPQVDQGRLDAADSAMSLLASRSPGHPSVHFNRARIEAVRGDYDAAADQVDSLAASRGTDPSWETRVLELRIAIAGVRGHLAEFRSAVARRVALHRERGVLDAALSAELGHAWLELWTLGDHRSTLASVDAALHNFPLEGMPPEDRPYLEVATLLAWAGDTERARELLEEWDAVVPAPGPRDVQQLHTVRGAIAVGDGQFDEGLDHFRRAVAEQPLGVRFWHLEAFAEAFDRAGARDSAIHYYREYVELPWLDRIYWDGTNLGPFLERLGQLCEDAGDLGCAQDAYARFIRLWERADPELQPRVRAAEERLAAIVARRG